MASRLTNPLRSTAAIAMGLLGFALVAPARADSVLPEFSAFDHVTLNVPDLSKAAAWYQATLGFSVVSKTPQFVILRRDQATLVLNHASVAASGADASVQPGFFHAAFAVPADKFQPSLAALRSRGIPVEAVSDIDHQNAYFSDSDGNTLELTATAPDGSRDAGAAVSWLADVLLDHLENVDFGTRVQRRLPLDRLPDLSLEAAQRQVQFSRQMLDRLQIIDTQRLPHETQLLAGILRQSLVVGLSAEKDFWYQFVVTPYGGGMLIQQVHQELSTIPLATAADRNRLLMALNHYAAMIDTVRAKTLAQAQRGLRVSRQALPGVVSTLQGLRDSIGPLCDSVANKGMVGASDAAAFKNDIRAIVTSKIIPAYESLLGTFDARYSDAAPAGVGLASYRGGKDAYQRRIFAETGLKLQPAAIHAIGLKRVAELETKLAAIRQQVGYKGSKQAFHQMLRTDPRFLAKTPADVEARYLQHMQRVAPLMPQYFVDLPRAPYGVRRLDPAAEPGMTFGYYNPPTAGEPLGIYYFNGSNLEKRSLVTSAHLIYHELLPGHHLRIALANENQRQHPLLSVLSFGAYEEGWAEYAANLAVEMGAMPDPYDQYGHYISQVFLASRLVVDTGMNYLGWSRSKSQRFMLDHVFESDTQIASETLRYSTDIPAQALDYRLGYETLVDGRDRARKALGTRFDSREFNTAVSNSGAMPLNVLEQHIDWFIAKH